MTATKTKKKKTKKPVVTNKALTFKQLLARVRKHEQAAALLKAATTTGWLTDESFITQISEKDMEATKEAYKEVPGAKRGEAPDITKNIPTEVSYMVTHVKEGAKRSKFWNGASEYTVDAQLFLTMKKLHPDAQLYLSPGEDMLIFANKSIVAMLPIQ